MSSRNLSSASALAVLSLLLAGIPASRADAATITVRTCRDTGVDSLRDAVARALSGDTISMTSLRCTRISLSHGPIVVGQDDLTLLGPNRALTLYGRDATQVLRHTGTGTLKLQGLSISHGLNEGLQAQGGCIASAGNVELRNSQVHHCVSSGVGDGNLAGGGGIFASGNVSLFTSAVYNNAAMSDGSASAAPDGGGVRAVGRLTAIHSDISYNVAQADGGGANAVSFTVRYTNIANNSAHNGGGLWTNSGPAGADRACTVANSTIARNHADLNVGGAFFLLDPVVIVNTTISGNSAPNGDTGGLYLPYGQYSDERALMVSNSTIAFNTQGGNSSECGALYWRGDWLRIESSIIANNTCFGQPSDIDVDYHGSPTILGSHNIIGTSSVEVPPDTISADPRLGALADNGGATRTHALLSGSPAIDTGANASRLGYDQRGAGFPRETGAGVDIGAFER
jgi:hypothetical protein